MAYKDLYKTGTCVRMKFKVGDNVKVAEVPEFILDSFPEYKKTIGRIGKIALIIENDPSLPYRIEFNGTEFGFVESELEWATKLDKILS